MGSVLSTFNDISDVINDVSSLNNNQNFTWLEVLIYTIIPFGQIAPRVIHLNGSLDRDWMFFPLFFIPPFSFLPVWLMKYGYVHKGQGSSPIDITLLLPLGAIIISIFLFQFTLPYVETYLPSFVGYIDDNKYTQYLVVFSMVVGAGILSNLYRRYTQCNSFSLGSMSKAIMNSVTAYGMGTLFALFMENAPLISLGYDIFTIIPFIGDYAHPLFTCLGYIGSYCLLNMFDHANRDGFCNATILGTQKEQMLIAASMVVLVYTHVLFPRTPPFALHPIVENTGLAAIFS